MKARAVSGHEVPGRKPIQLELGDEVSVGERDAQWPAFVFVTSASGEGWVPSRHLSGNGGTASVITPYDTTELALAAGDEVAVLERDDASGWWWCRRTGGEVGWVPVSALDQID